MSFNFTGLQNKERGKGHPALLRGKNRHKTKKKKYTNSRQRDVSSKSSL